MALGNSGVAFDPATLDVWIGETQVVAQGRPTSYDARSVSQHLRGADCRIAADLHAGDARAVALGCDLSKAYVDINAAYMT